MKILIVLTYYRPHISGLTIYAERLAKAFVKRGHSVTVLTSQFDPNCPLDEVQDGVRIVRAPVLFRLSKGVIMPTFGKLANQLVRENDVIQLHLPQFDAAGIALRGRLMKKPTVITYHCDLQLPVGVFNRMANLGVKLMNQLTAWFTHSIVTYTQDYADHSIYLKRYPKKLHIIPPPVELPIVSSEMIDSFNKDNNPNDQHPVIGMAARFATEKGVEILLNAMSTVLLKYPEALVQFVGPYNNIIGEEKYFDRLSPIIEKLVESKNWRYIGSLNPQQMAAFYPNLDLLVLPSLNSTEAFGLVQIEAMMNGIPCVASSLPGVRQPVLIHNMGEIFPIGDSKSLAEKILNVLDEQKTYKIKQGEYVRYNPESIAIEYEILFNSIQTKLHPKLNSRSG